MCGLFGMVRQPNASDAAGEALVRLGRLAVERGLDSAGMAFVDADGNVVTDKASGSFNKVFAHSDFALIKTARVIVGHTRWATQGDTKNAANVSPMQVNSLIATHNGDVEVASIPGLSSLPKPLGGTDTERLFQAIAAEASLEGIAKILSLVKGRAALAWVDTNISETLFLARAALSPIATALDSEGNLYWASNPDWFRQVDKAMQGDVGFTDITLFNEGTLAVVNTKTITVEKIERFTPIARGKDNRMLDLAVWRGFTAADKVTDKKGFCHTLAPEPTRTYSHQGTTGSLWDNWSSGTGAERRSRNSDLWDSVDDAMVAQSKSLVAWSSTTPVFESIEDEVMDFLCEWADEGCSEDVYERIVDARTMRQQKDVCEDYGMSSVALIPMLVPLMTEWMHTESTEDLQGA